MEWKRFDDRIVLRLDPGEEITASVLALAEKEGITCASVSGIGAADEIGLGIFDLEKKTYARYTHTGNHEITALCGSITTLDGKPYQHLHITAAAPDGTVIGGHLFRAVISLTCEIFIDTVAGSVGRRFSPEIGINRMVL